MHARTQKAWFGSDERFTHFTWAADYRDKDQNIIAQIAGDVSNHNASLRQGDRVEQHAGNIDEKVIQRWLAKAFPLIDLQDLEQHAQAIIQEMQWYTELPSSLIIWPAGAPPISLTDEMYGGFFPGLSGTMVGRISSRPSLGALALVLTPIILLWLGIAIVIVLIGRRPLKRKSQC